jgi:hypothetical protein
MAVNTTFVSGAILTAAQMNNLPWGQVGYATKASDQAISTEADIASLSVTWTAVAGRVYKFTAQLNQSTVIATDTTIYLNNGTSNIAEAIGQLAAGARNSGAVVFYVTGITAGSKTYKLRYAAANAVTIYGATVRATLASQFIVEDIGAA